MKAESKINVLWVHEHPQMSEMKKQPYSSVKEEEKPREKHTEMTMQINFYWLQFLCLCLRGVSCEEERLNLIGQGMMRKFLVSKIKRALIVITYWFFN